MSSLTPQTAAARVLQEAGLLNPARTARLIDRAIAALDLDLTGLTVLTEAATGPYVVTPVIAARAGASRVIALTRASRYGTVDEVIAQTRALEVVCDVEHIVEIHSQRREEFFEQADVVTNLGFVRPLDRGAVSLMRRGAVIPLMCEAWEARPGDVDLTACRDAGVPVLGTNEDHPAVGVFDYSGWLCLKMLLAAQIEGHKSTVVVVGADKFGGVIARRLHAAGVDVRVMPDLKAWAISRPAGHIDALVIADYRREDLIIGPEGDIDAVALVDAVGPVTVIPFAGRVDVAGLLAAGAAVLPPEDAGSHRMIRTLADLGSRPVIELHAAGLKVGALAYRGLDSVPASYRTLIQPVGDDSTELASVPGVEESPAVLPGGRTSWWPAIAPAGSRPVETTPARMVTELALLAWVFGAVAVELLLFGPPILWTVLSKIGIHKPFWSLRLWLETYLR